MTLTSESGGQGVVGSNPATPTTFLNEINGARRRWFGRAAGGMRTQAQQMARKRPQLPTRLPTLVAILFLAATGARAQPLAPETFAGHATVQDGDTIIVATRIVRLQGIDAAEIGQSCRDAAGASWRCGRAAADTLAAMIGGQIVTCVTDPRDPADLYGRTLALCAAGDADLSLGLLRAGHAVAYHTYLTYREGDARPHRAAFIAAEEEARAARRGLWRGQFDLPSTWRRAQRGNRP